MISPLYAAWLACQGIYLNESVFDQVLKIGCDVVGIKKVAGTLMITPLGTVDLLMWESNLDAMPTYHPVFGNMHSGFLESAEAIYKVVKPLIVGPVSFQGHSRGAALANILASLCALDGIKVAHLFLFECPNVGYQRYADFCAEQVINEDICFELSTVNGLDPVPYLPLAPFVASYPTTDLDNKPGGFKNILPIDYHLGKTIYAGILERYTAAA